VGKALFNRGGRFGGDGGFAGGSAMQLICHWSERCQKDR
jgi:hypothetical protein